MEKTKQGLILSISLALVFIITVGLSYAYFSARLLGTENASTITLSGGIMEIKYSEDSNLIELYGIYPKEKEWFTKTITLKGTNTTDLEMNYKIGIEIEENTFSEGALTYSIKNTLNESGTPLEDIESTIIKTSGTQYIGYGYFNTVDKKEHEYELKIYFKNNGSEQNEDQKARFKGKIVVEEVLDDELITVTFNPEGGELNTTTKKVLASGVYGELPEPTKEGYEFLGWNGKNLLNIKDRIIRDAGAYAKTTIRNFDGKSIYIGLTADNYNNGNFGRLISRKDNSLIVESILAGYGVAFDIMLLPNTSYTLSINKTYEGVLKMGNYNPNGESISYEVPIDAGSEIYNYYTFNNNYNKTVYNTIVFATTVNIEALFYNIMLEEGTEATTYEPYYITKDLNIVQNYDHTLKAIWKEI